MNICFITAVTLLGMICDDSMCRYVPRPERRADPSGRRRQHGPGRRDTRHGDPGRVLHSSVSTPAALDSFLLQRGVFVRLGMGWFGGLTTRQCQQRTRHLYDNRVYLERNQSTRNMKLPSDKYTGDPDAVVCSWVFLEGNTAEQADGATIGAVATKGVVVSRSGRHKRPT